MIILRLWAFYEAGSWGWLNESTGYENYDYAFGQHNAFAPLALIVGDYIPYGYNLSRQWECTGEEVYHAAHLTQWHKQSPNRFVVPWEPHP